MQNHCAVANCSSTKTDSQPLFRFPRDPERCKKWVENCQRDDLVDKSPQQLSRYYRLCGKHFEASSFVGEAPSTLLKDSAIPSVFDVPSQPQNGQQKRSKQTPEEEDTKNKGRKKIKRSRAEPKKDDAQTAPEGEDDKERLKSLFEALILLGEQNIPLKGSDVNKENRLTSGNFEALLEYRMGCGDEALQKAHDANKEFCSSAELDQLIEVCEECVRAKLLEQVNQNRFFSLITDDLVKISGRWFLPVFLRFVDQANTQREVFVAFLPFDEDDEALADKLISEMSDKWGLNMENCRGQAHFCSGTHFSKIKEFSTKLTETCPMATLTPRSTCMLNTSLATGMALSGVQLVMSTFKKIESFFGQSPSLHLELEHAISVVYPNKEEKVNELKEVCRTNWTRRQDAFEVALEVLEPLLLCVDSVYDNEDMNWSDQLTHSALEISKALTDFEFIMALVVLKNILTLTQAFGKNMQGKAAEAVFAVKSLKAVLHSLKEVLDNITVYHEFWHDEAVDIATRLEAPVKVPRSFLRRHQLEHGTAIGSESYYKEHLSVPVVNHVLREMTDLFSDNHVKTLRCLSLVPAVIDQNKAVELEEENLEMYKKDLPNPGSVSAELHCWWVKWSQMSKGETAPATLHETIQLPDVKFFPNVLRVLKVIGTLPNFALEDSSDVTYRRFKAYMENTPDKFKSKSLALLNINRIAGCDLDSMVEVYTKTYGEKEVVKSE